MFYPLKYFNFMNTIIYCNEICCNFNTTLFENSNIYIAKDFLNFEFLVTVLLENAVTDLATHLKTKQLNQSYEFQPLKQ